MLKWQEAWYSCVKSKKHFMLMTRISCEARVIFIRLTHSLKKDQPYVCRYVCMYLPCRFGLLPLLPSWGTYISANSIFGHILTSTDYWLSGTSDESLLNHFKIFIISLISALQLSFKVATVGLPRHTVTAGKGVWHEEVTWMWWKLNN